MDKYITDTDESTTLPFQLNNDVSNVPGILNLINRLGRTLFKRVEMRSPVSRRIWVGKTSSSILKGRQVTHPGHLTLGPWFLSSIPRTCTCFTTGPRTSGLKTTEPRSGKERTRKSRTVTLQTRRTRTSPCTKTSDVPIRCLSRRNVLLKDSAGNSGTRPPSGVDWSSVCILTETGRVRGSPRFGNVGLSKGLHGRKGV